jgi:hypothetical protein
MKINLFKLLVIFDFLNEHYIFTTIFACIIFLPFTYFIFDGFKFSDNKLMNNWQKLNILFVLAILLILFINIITINSIYNSDGSEDKDPHIKLAEKLYDGAKSLGDKLGDGGAASAGIYAAAKMMPKGAPIAVKAGAIAGGALLGVLGKQGGQAISSIFKSSNSGGAAPGSGNINQGKVNTNVSDSSPQAGGNLSIENTECSEVLMANSDLNNFDYSILSNDIVYSAIFDVNLLSLVYGDNKVEVLLSVILIINIIKLIMELLLIFSLCSTYLSTVKIELKWLLSFKFISESFRLKLVNIIKNVLNFYSKSAKLNIIIVLVVMVLCDIQSIYFLDIFLEHIETMCNYYIKFKSQV